MLGTQKKPSLSLKAAETKGLLEFCVFVLESRSEQVEALRNADAREQGRLLLAAGLSALRFEESLSRLPVEVVRLHLME